MCDMLNQKLLAAVNHPLGVSESRMMVTGPCTTHNSTSNMLYSAQLPRDVRLVMSSRGIHH